MFSFGLSSFISKVFVADFEHVFVCWKRYSTKTIVILILKYLAQQTSTYSMSAVETLKANSRDCASLLTTCSMSKTLFKCFLVYYGVQCFCSYDFFCEVFIVNFKQISRLDLLLSVIGFVLSSDEATRGVLYNYAIFAGKRLCLGLFLIKL